MAQANDETFRVIDRRLFTPEGELREEARDKIAAEQTSSDAKTAKPAADAAKAQPGSKAEPGTNPQTGPESAPAAEPPRRMPAFELLIDLVARNAVAFLGGLADPRTGQPMVDLEGAREVVDMLDALREKTRGNLALEEEQLLLDVIGSLKMSYLEVSKAAAAAATAGRERGRGKA
ncbi:MAG TPA: DUF1844 domain-containing protein [Candidatus Acidoferrales bacterium]|nr:DUF1844 domain-containing protein [Candidatus Acidoferrales bacterium]